MYEYKSVMDVYVTGTNREHLPPRERTHFRRHYCYDQGRSLGHRIIRNRWDGQRYFLSYIVVSESFSSGSFCFCLSPLLLSRYDFSAYSVGWHILIFSGYFPIYSMFNGRELFMCFLDVVFLPSRAGIWHHVS